MERRHFLRALLGVAAATALPSEVWPFRKIFIPPTLPIIPLWDETYYCSSNALNEATIEALQLEVFAKEIPDLIFKSDSLYRYFKSKEKTDVLTRLVCFPPRQVA